MNIESISISEIKANPNNPRVIKDDKFAKLVKSIKDFPEMLKLRPVVVNDDLIVLGGNMRLKACKEAGLKHIPIIKASSLTPEQQREFIIKDNVGFGEWDWELITNEWDAEQVMEWGLDIPDFKIEAEAHEDDYEIPDEVHTDIVLGDLFEIGPHKLLCGDSTNANDVARLMGNDKADLLFTDPPYNVAFNGRSGKFDVIENDDLPEDEFNDFITGFLSILEILKPQTYYICCNWAFYGVMQLKLKPKACIVWAKNVFGLGRGYRHQHEFILFDGFIDASITNESDLWQIKKDTNYKHPTQKPVELSARAIKNSSKEGNVIVDLFGGSGSTLAGIHQLKRLGRVMELDPKYCQVIVDRMRKLDPTIEIKKNGVIV